jgi:hypothetical protein
MKKRRLPYVLLGAIVLAAVILSIILCRHSSSSANFSFKLEIHDSLPKEIIIQDDGTATFKEGDKINKTKISEGGISSLRQFLQESNFFSLTEKYEGSGCCDFIANTITITLEGKTHSVYCYNQCPAEFDKMKDRIISLSPVNVEYSGFA